MIITDNPPSLYIVSLEEYQENIITLIMHTMALIFFKDSLYNS